MEICSPHLLTVRGSEYSGEMSQNIEFSKMNQWPAGRDASWYLHAEVEVAGVRYPTRLMIEGIALADFNYDFEGPRGPVVEELYRREILKLLAEGRLKPADESKRINTVFFSNGTARTQVQEGDIVIEDAVDKLRDVAISLGHTVKGAGPAGR